MERQGIPEVPVSFRNHCNTCGLTTEFVPTEIDHVTAKGLRFFCQFCKKRFATILFKKPLHCFHCKKATWRWLLGYAEGDYLYVCEDCTRWFPRGEPFIEVDAEKETK